ncbi:MAG: hypothetical protein WKF56_09065 [Candidatus Limnocylindrales bacterium]
MTDPRRMPDDRPNTEGLPLLEGIQALQGEEMPEDQDAFLTPDQMESRRTPTRTELDQGDSLPDAVEASDESAHLDGLSMDGLRDGETDDYGVAAQEGYTYVPPSDPPIVPSQDDPQGAEIAAGMGSSALDDPYDEDHRTTEDLIGGDLNERIHDALRADAATSVLNARLVIATRGSTAIVRGVVDDIDDADNVVAVIERVEGIEEVLDETELADV